MRMHVCCVQVFHMERSNNSLLNLQNTLPLFRYIACFSAHLHTPPVPSSLSFLYMPALQRHPCLHKVGLQHALTGTFSGRHSAGAAWFPDCCCAHSILIQAECVLLRCVMSCSDYDKEALAVLGAEFEIDFVSLAYTRTR